MSQAPPEPSSTSASLTPAIVAGVIAGLVAGVSSGVTTYVALTLARPAGTTPVALAPPVPAGAPPQSLPAAAQFVTESGEATIPLRGETKKGEAEVFYKNRFATPPQLSFPQGLNNNCFVSKQTVQGFTITRDESGSSTYYTVAVVKWETTGQRAE